MKHSILRAGTFFAGAIAVAIGIKLVDYSQAQVWKWSQTAGTNATADPSINWAEGMAPSQVNDSARAMMAALAKYRDDISGAILTAGTTSAFTLTTSQVIAATPTDGQMVAFLAHGTNDAGATLQVDGGNVYPIGSPGSHAVGAGVIVGGTPYVAVYHSGYWNLRNSFGNPFNVPIGAVIAFAGGTIPNSNFAFPAGQCLSTATYPSLFTAIGTTYGASACPAGQFPLPDLRGRVVAGLDTMNGTPAGRVTSAGSGIDGATIGSSGGAQNVTLATGNLPQFTPSGTVTGTVTFTPGGTISPITPAGTISPITPAGSVSGSIGGNGNNISVAVSGNGGSISGSTSGNGGSISGSATGNSSNIGVAVTDPGHAHDVKYNIASVRNDALQLSVATAITSGGSTTGTGAAVSATTGITAAVSANTIAATLTPALASNTIAATLTPALASNTIAATLSAAVNANNVATALNFSGGTLSGTPVTPAFSGTAVTPTFAGAAQSPTISATFLGNNIGSLSPTAVTVMPPTLILRYIIRIL